MKLDIVFVTYNSSKWLKKNIESIVNADYNLKDVSLLYYDNHSTDDTIKILKEYQKKYEENFCQIKIIEGTKNKGFGFGNNIGAKYGNSEYIFFLNIDTEIEKDTLKKLKEEIESSPKEVAMWELHQLPYEHPKFYDPITGYTTWASGACLVIKRDIFEKIKGFDKNLFMYCEDVEISWHIRNLGYQIRYLPKVLVHHYSYSKTNEFKKIQFEYSIINNIYLRCKYGNIKNILKSAIMFARFLKKDQLPNLSAEKYKVVKKEMVGLFFKMIWKYIKACFFNLTHRKHKNFHQKFWDGIDYEITKLDPFYESKGKLDGPLVSILVRTCGRPKVLRETLISIRNQTYKNIETIVVEDGKNISEELIKKEFSDMNITYIATNDKVGRSKAGNIAMETAKGKYLNFLDDDDVFFPEHVEILVNEMEEKNLFVAYTTAFETPIVVHSKDPYVYEMKDIVIRYHGHFSRMKLSKNNITPIQAVMFRKEVFEKCGGLDTNIDALEDWDLWLRFAYKYDFYYIPRTTSVYRVPYNQKISSERQEFLNSSLEYLTNKHRNERMSYSPFDIFWDENE